MKRLHKFTGQFVAASLLAALLIAVISISSPSPSFAEKGGKGGGNGGGGSSDPPPVMYSTHTIPSTGNSYVRGMNNWGMVLGDDDNGAFLYDSTNDAFHSLDFIASLGAQLDALTGEPGWWFKNSAWTINDLGEIVGSVANPDDSGYRPYVLETFLSNNPLDWSLELLPDFGSVQATALDINSHGDVLIRYERPDGTREMCLYNPWEDTAENPQDPVHLNLISTSHAELNNNGQVAGIYVQGTAFLYDATSDSMELIDINSTSRDPRGSIYGLNDSGQFVGAAQVNSGKKWTENSIYLYTNGVETIVEGHHFILSSPGRALNSDSDVFYIKYLDREVNESYLVRDGQTWKLNDLVSDGNLASNVLTMSERDNTGFPQFVSISDRRAIILTPFIP